MTCCRLLLASILLAVLASPAPAGIFGKKTKPTPEQRVPELLSILKTDGDEHKRANAAEELRQYDPKQFPAIVPALIDVLMSDAKPSVRSEAAQTLGKLRPVTREAGMALEQAVAKDASMRVRLQARSALLHYHWAGYHGGKDSQPPAVQSKEPPLAPPTSKAPTDEPASPRLQTKPVAQPDKPAQPAATPAVNQSNVPKPLPTGPPLVPTEAPRLEPAPARPAGEGPELNPQD
jgi:hypothetical protein